MESVQIYLLNKYIHTATQLILYIGDYGWLTNMLNKYSIVKSYMRNGGNWLWGEPKKDHWEEMWCD